jgi:hypothetical protein
MAPWTMHDLRRSLVTGMNDRGLAQPHVIEAIVNHISGHRGGIAGIYNRAVYMDERRRALEAWAKLITRPRGREQQRGSDAHRHDRQREPATAAMAA